MHMVRRGVAVHQTAKDLRSPSLVTKHEGAKRCVQQRVGGRLEQEGHVNRRCFGIIYHYCRHQTPRMLGLAVLGTSAVTSKLDESEGAISANATFGR